jgi:hypothetical protein
VKTINAIFLLHIFYKSRTIWRMKIIPILTWVILFKRLYFIFKSIQFQSNARRRYHIFKHSIRQIEYFVDFFDEWCEKLIIYLVIDYLLGNLQSLFNCQEMFLTESNAKFKENGSSRNFSNSWRSHDTTTRFVIRTWNCVVF